MKKILSFISIFLFISTFSMQAFPQYRTTQPRVRRLIYYSRPIRVYSSRIMIQSQPIIIICPNCGDYQRNYRAYSNNSYANNYLYNSAPNSSLELRMSALEESVESIKRNVNEISQRKFLSDEQWRQINDIKSEIKALRASLLELKSLINK